MLALVKRCCWVLHSTLALLLPTVAFVAPSFAFVVPTVALASAPCTTGLAVEFRFHASAPVVDALLASNGSIAVTSVDGYVHALGPNGRFLWSYTLDSAPHSLDIGADGRVYAVSESGMVHVLQPSGERQWGGQLPAGMVPTGQVAHSERGVVFVPSNLNVYAFSVGSGLLWRAFIGSPIISGPVIGADGDAWLVARNGEVHRIRTPSQRSKFSVQSAESTRIIAAESDRVVLLDASGVTSRSLTGDVSWSIPNVEQVTSDARVVRTASKWVWLNEKGEQKAARELELDVSGPPSHADGLVYVPTTDGRLYVFGAEGDVEWCQVAHAPLLSPHVYRRKGPAVVASGDGWLASIRIRSHEGLP